jgi:hypothetical protein
VLAQNWSDAVPQVVLDMTLLSPPASVEVVVDERTPLRVEGRALESELWEPRSTQSHTLRMKGVWKSAIYRFAPAAQDDTGAVVSVGGRVALGFPRSLWSGEVEIDVRYSHERERGRAKLSVGKDRALRCQHTTACARLSLEEVRGLAATAFGECENIRNSKRPLNDGRRSLELRVASGPDLCRASLSRQCLPEYRSELEWLFRRLLDPLPTSDVHDWCARH